MSRFSELQQLIARRDPAVAAVGASAILASVLAVQAARIIWALVVPLGPVGAPPAQPVAAAAAADFGMLDRFDPFHRPAAAVPAIEASSAGLRLFGVRIGRQSSAIIGRPDGRQVSVRVGEEVSPGVTLRAVAPDHVELLAPGGRTTLAFAPPSSAGAPPPPPASEPASAPARPMAGAVFTSSTPGADLLARAGLQPGDIIISANGLAVSDPQSIEALGRDLVSGREVVVQYVREGQSRSATLKVPTQ